MAWKSVALSFVCSVSTTFAPALIAALRNSAATPSPYAVVSSTTATVLPFRFVAAYLPRTLPSCASFAQTRNAVLKPCCVYFGFVADGEICGMPASL